MFQAIFLSSQQCSGGTLSVKVKMKERNKICKFSCNTVAEVVGILLELEVYSACLFVSLGFFFSPTPSGNTYVQ